MPGNQKQLLAEKIAKANVTIFLLPRLLCMSRQSPATRTRLVMPYLTRPAGRRCVSLNESPPGLSECAKEWYVPKAPWNPEKVTYWFPASSRSIWHIFHLFPRQSSHSMLGSKEAIFFKGLQIYNAIIFALFLIVTAKCDSELR